MGQQVQRRGKRFEADRMRKCGPGQYYETHEQEHADAEQAPADKGTANQQREPAAALKEEGGEGKRHCEVEEEPEGCAEAAARVGVLPLEAAGHRLQQTHRGYAVVGRERNREENIERAGGQASNCDGPPARALHHKGQGEFGQASLSSRAMREGNERRHMLRIGSVTLSELLVHPALLQPNLGKNGS